LKQKPIKLIGGCGAVVLFFLCACPIAAGVFAPRTEQGTPKTPVEGVATSATNDVPTSISQSTPTTESQTGNLPGLSSADVTINLGERGFECAGVQEINSFYTWTCSRDEAEIYSSTVMAWSRTIDTLDFIEVSVNQFIEPSEEISALIIGFVATMPYDGATPEVARTWIEASLPMLTGEPGNRIVENFGGVEFVIFGPRSARGLEMGYLPVP
jgi:hypothetical protein